MSVSAIGTSTVAPSPVTVRPWSAATIANAAVRPETLSPTALATYCGLPAIHSCCAASPETAWAMSSYAGRSAYGPLGSEAADHAVHQCGVISAEGVGVGTAFHERVRAHVGHEHVGAVGERLQRAPAVVGGQVEHHTALVAIAVEEHRAHAAVDVRAQMTGDVTGRRLDLDDVGAEVGEQERRVRTRDDTREVDHPDALEGQLLHRSSTAS